MAARVTVKGVSSVERPSERIIASANATADVQDKSGRTIRIRRFNALLKLDFAEVMGSDRMKNEGLVAPAILAFCVSAIDGDPVAQPSSYQELRALVARLDEVGIQAIGEGQVEHFGVGVQDEVADLKN